MNWKDAMILGVWIGAILALVVTWIAGGVGIGAVGVVAGIACIVALMIESHGYVIVIQKDVRR